MLEHQQPFDSLLEGGRNTFMEDAGVRMTWRSGSGYLLLQSRSESALQDALTSHTGLRLPAPQEVSVRGDWALLWLTPREWLLELPASEAASLRAALIPRLASSLAVVIDMSDAYVTCDVSGARAADVLMSGCTLDLRADAFPAGRSARTALADIPAIIWNPGGEPRNVRCIVDRSFAKHVRDWLVDAAQVRV